MGISKAMMTLIAAASPLLMHQAEAAVISCSAAAVTVTSRTIENAAVACVALRQSVTQFDACGLPPLTKPLRIDVVEGLEPGYVGLYHLGKDKIEVLSPSAIVDIWNDDSAFLGIDITTFFKSAIIHELAHAATDDIPCPFASCMARDEYIAYAMQVLSLPPDALSAFEETSPIDRLISTDELSPAIMFMAPNLFTQKVWAHFQQHDDGCAFIGQLVRGEKIIDVSPF